MKILKIIIILVVVISVGYFGITWGINFFKIDSCLDRGGRWDYVLKKCECLDSIINGDIKVDTISVIYKHIDISEKCAVIYEPDTLKIYNAKKKNEEGFYVGADDAMFYVSQARTILDSNRIKIIETDLRYIDFYKQKKLYSKFDLNTDEKFWGLILFNGNDKPEEVDLTSFESELERIMKK